MGGKKANDWFLIKSCSSGLLGHSEHFEQQGMFKSYELTRPYPAASGTKEEDSRHTLQAINTRFDLAGLWGRFLWLPSGSALCSVTLRASKAQADVGEQQRVGRQGQPAAAAHGPWLQQPGLHRPAQTCTSCPGALQDHRIPK